MQNKKDSKKWLIYSFKAYTTHEIYIWRGKIGQSNIKNLMKTSLHFENPFLIMNNRWKK